MVHAQDHLMNAITFKDLAVEVVGQETTPAKHLKTNNIAPKLIRKARLKSCGDATFF